MLTWIVAYFWHIVIHFTINYLFLNIFKSLFINLSAEFVYLQLDLFILIHKYQHF